ncbi:MAG: GH3 auxin-responsive promoter family protein [Candidatus Bathyarchaeota archaeon]|nr:GH3 auxin-responsive promoter family protein [Candidatus Bathyarchaeota archaeon]
MLPDPDAINNILSPYVQPWYDSLADPQKAQMQVLSDLLPKYAQTDYGAKLGAEKIGGIADYQKRFPILNYEAMAPYLTQVRQSSYKAFLSEPPQCWVMTRGSTGHSKVIPATQTHLKQIYSCGARAIINYAVRKKQYEVFLGVILNLNFPSAVHTMTVDGKEQTYGYSSGTYARLNPMFDRVSLLPRQEEIDKLGSGIGRHDWERRFDLVYEMAKDQNVTATMGVTPVILSFARYIKRRYGKLPCDIWKPKALFCTSVRKIQFKYGPILKKYFGDAPIVEMYTATEGVFGQQLDDYPYIGPNYDAYLFEVATGRGVKLLHELERGEWGSLIISSCMLPRYEIGDLIEAAGKNHFRVFGRKNALTLLEHRLYRMFMGRLL